MARPMNHVRDAVYGIVAHPTMSQGDKAAMLKRLTEADAQASQILQTDVPTPMPVAPPTASFEPAQGPPTASFAPAPIALPMMAGAPMAAPTATAAFPDANAGLGDEIDRRKRLALAALSQPTAYPAGY